MKISDQKIREIVKKYNSDEKKNLDYWLDYFKNLRNIEEVIERATLAIGPEDKIHRHQYRIKNNVKNEKKKRLLKRKIEIEKCYDFNCIFKILENEKVKGFGDLAVYDTSLRICSFLRKYPKEVYIQRGSRVGAGRLGLNVNRRSIPICEFPEPLQKLKPYYIEDILCIYIYKYNLG